MTKRVALARARKAAGYTQEGLAEALGIDRSTIVRWEAGDTEPLPHKRPKLGRLLGLNAVQLESLLAEDSSPPTDGQANLAEDLGVPFDPMKRRTLMKWGVAATAASGFGTESIGQVGKADIAKLQRTTNRLCKLDHQHGGETLWQSGVSTARSAHAMLEQGHYGDSVGQQLLLATGNLQIRTGWLACDAGQHDVARNSFADALTIGRQAGDAEIESRALAGLGFQSNLIGRPREGLRFSGAADSAARGFGQRSRMAAVPLLHLAVASARSSDFQSSQAAITRARKALDADQSSETASWAAFMSPMEIDAVEATCAVEANKAVRAEKLLEQAIAAYGDGFARNVALYRVRLAGARERAGAVDGAVEAANEVLDAIDDGLESWRVNMEFARVLKRLSTYTAVPGVSQLLDRYQAAAN
ncbi:helix-turn-helix transcriptional regulator [Amycolatopsis sp. NPDC059657]|uniref:helix-turn-helix transcriptional regulator n=1 Tax=Amycolatopsis sp. NPDC059657 TaxID=3346899 RepID=UPI003671669A